MRLKGPPTRFFFGIVRLFSKIFNVSEESPFRVFWYFATEYMLIKPKGSLFTFFGTLRHFLKEKKSKISSFFQKSLRFLSLRYSADFRRSRLVVSSSIIIYNVLQCHKCHIWNYHWLFLYAVSFECLCAYISQIFCSTSYSSYILWLLKHVFWRNNM